jgi:acetyl esterase/lipase
LAAVASLLTPVFLVAQLLIVPVIDNSASPSSNSWLENRHAPWLSPEKMLWYQSLYLPNPADRKQWTASPIFAPNSVFKGRTIAKAYIKVVQVDVLRREGIEYAQFLEEKGVIVDFKEYTGVPHAALDMAGRLTKGREMLADTICNLKEALNAVSQLSLALLRSSSTMEGMNG